jgi:diketogulonate reductase-like aldo/keto reductase
VALNDGRTIPQIGLGVHTLHGPRLAAAIEAALDAGYRCFDTAAEYGNEAGVGEALRAGRVPREQLFVATKLWNAEQGYEPTLAACRASLERLGMDYIDLYLIHWPCPEKQLYVDTWRAFETLQAEGLIRSAGVSNFLPDHLDRLAAASALVPAVNQIELHPELQQQELRALGRARGIVTEAWSPFAVGRLTSDERLAVIASAHGKTIAQIILRWHVQLGNVVIPRSSSPERIAENIAIFDFALMAEDMAVIEGLDAGRRVGADPRYVN